MSSLAGVSRAQGIRPNIIYLMTDDQRREGLGITDPFGEVVTPKLDTLARRGVLFNNAYANSPVCMPARAIVFAGMYEHKTGVNFESGELPLPLWNDCSYAHLLKAEAGYRIAFAGKLGFDIEELSDYSTGFDAWGGFSGSGQGSYNTANNPAGIAAYAAEHPHVTRALGAFGRDFIESSVAAGEPFCLSISFKSPHKPHDNVHADDAALYSGATISLRPNFMDMNHPVQANLTRQYHQRGEWTPEAQYRSHARGSYYPLISGVDTAVGMILDALEDPNGDGDTTDAVATNTVIIFTSDNGYFSGSHNFQGKAQPYEEASGVPLIVYDPRAPLADNTNQLHTTEALAGHIDMAPTILDYAGVEIPALMDGISLRPVVDNPSDKLRDHLFVGSVWSWVDDDHPRAVSVISETHKYIHWAYADENLPQEEELYNLVNDPYELTNRVDDVHEAAALATLKKAYDEFHRQWMDDVLDYDYYERFIEILDRSRSWRTKPFYEGTDGANKTSIEGYYNVFTGKNFPKAISVTGPASVAEDAGTANYTVSVPVNVGTDTVITLESTDTSELTVPAEATISSGSKSVGITVSIINDEAADGSQRVVIIGSASNYVAGAAYLKVADEGDAPAGISINNVGADPDNAQFIELYDGGIGNTPLDGLILVLYHGADGAIGAGSYTKFNLNGYTSDTNGYFVLGASAVPGAAITFEDGTLREGETADHAVTLYRDSTRKFPTGVFPIGNGLVDRVVYEDTNGDLAAALNLVVSKDTHPSEEDILNRGVIGALNIGVTTDGNGDGNTNGVAIPLTLNGVEFLVDHAIPDGNSPRITYDRTFGNTSTGLLQIVTATAAVGGFSSFDASASFSGILYNLFSSIVTQLDDKTITLNCGSLKIGHDYHLQLFFASGTQDRVSDIKHQGTTLATVDNIADSETIITLSWTAGRASETFTLEASVGNGPALAGVIFASSAVDRDGDGLSDALEQLIINAADGDAFDGLEDVLPDDDFDGDGASNLAEQIAGTDPSDPGSVFVIANFRDAADDFAFTAPTTEGRIYTVFWSLDFETWTPYATHIGNGAQLPIVVATATIDADDGVLGNLNGVFLKVTVRNTPP